MPALVQLAPAAVSPAVAAPKAVPTPVQLDGSAAGLPHLVDPSVTRTAVKVDGPRADIKRPNSALPVEGRFDPAPVAVRVDPSKWETAAPGGEFGAPPLAPSRGVTMVAPVWVDGAPADKALVGSTTPTLIAFATSTAGGVDYQFLVCDKPPAQATWCGQSSVLTNGVWKVPAGNLAWDKEYFWQVTLIDRVSTQTALSPVRSFTTGVREPLVTSNLANRMTEGQEFHQLVGNYTTAFTDATVATVGPALSLTRSYNSLDPRSDGMFGAGWSSRWDMKVVSENGGNTLLVTYPDGRQFRFASKGGGAYEAPPGMHAALATVAGGGWKLMDKTSTTYSFDSTGKLTKVADARGRAQDLTYSGGKLSTVTGVGGRKLTFTWTGNHVTSVATDPVSGSPLTWNYTYTGDNLTQVCAPVVAPNCTAYTYDSGSQYRTRVLDSDPVGYWRLGEASGTSAADLGSGGTSATYTSVTLGQAGALGGSTDTAISTTTGSVRLPQNTIARLSTQLSIEAWFKTTQNGIVVSAASAATSNVPRQPVIYVGNDGKLRAQFLERPETGGPSPIIPITSSGTVNNGAWHHAVLIVNDSVETLYLDGVSVGSGVGVGKLDPWPAFASAGNGIMGSWASFWPSAPTSSTATFPFKGQLDEVAVFDRPLTAQEVQRHFAAGQAQPNKLSKITLPSGRVWATNVYDTATDRLKTHTDADGGVWQIGVPTYDKVTGLSTVAVTDPASGTLKYVHDAWRNYRLVSETDQLNKITSYSYDTGGFVTKKIDRNGNPTEWFNDARGNVIGVKYCRAAGNCQTEHRTYHLTAGNEFDPRNDRLTVVRDARSASATDNTYATTVGYTAQGELASVTAPATADFPSGRAFSQTFTDGTEVAIGGGTMPAGLVEVAKDPKLNETTYAYNSSGDLAELTESSGLVTRFTYDPLGRVLSRTVVSDAYPAGVTTTFAYDGRSALTRQTGPGLLNELSSVSHTAEARLTYDADGNRATFTLADTTGGDPDRTTSYTYDTHGRLETITGPESAVAHYAHNTRGALASYTDPAGALTTYGYTSRAELATITLKAWTGNPNAPTPPVDVVTASYAYDPGGRLATYTDVMGRKTTYTYFTDGLLSQKIATQARLNGSTTPRDVVLEDNLYDAATHLTRQTIGGGKTRTDYVIDAAGRLVSSTLDPAGLARKTTYGYDANTNITTATRTATGTARTESLSFEYDAADQPTKSTVENGATDLVTTWTYDDRGLVEEVTPPRGNEVGATRLDHTTLFRYDPAGQLVEVETPPVAVERDGNAPVTERPSTRFGYNSGGWRTHVSGPEGRTSTAVYDKVGRLTSITGTPYTPPGGTALTPSISYGYDTAGRQTTVTDPRGQVTNKVYDALGRLVRITDPPATTGATRGNWDYTYTLNGETASATDPTGARREATYDDLGRTITSTIIERKPSNLVLTRNLTYDDAGNLLTTQRPAGDTTTRTVNPAGELTELIEPSTDKTLFAYDLAGRETKITDPLGNATAVDYDLAGRPTAIKDLDAASQVLRTRSMTFDADGNVTASTDAEGHTTTRAFDPAGRLTQLVEPIETADSITTSFGYDAAGARTRYTDGRGNLTLTTYNTLGLRESLIEPSTTQHPALTDRTWTTSYDAAGNPVKLVEPGGVQLDRTFDNLGRLTAENGTGAEAADVSRAYSYDLAGRATGAGNLAFTFNDRGRLLTTTAGGVGQASFGYDANGRLNLRTDAAGTANFTWDGDDRLATAKDPLTNLTITYGYDKADRLTSATHGAGGPVRTYTWDALNRLATDTLKTSGGATLAAIGYGYDDEDRLTSKTTTGTAGSGTNEYAYDQAGRLSSWTAPGGAVTVYDWDKSGNRTGAGAETFTYDQRNRLTSGGGTSYTYAPRGTIATATTGATTKTYTFDAFDRMTADGDAAYGYDALDRLASRTRLGVTTRFRYSATGNDLAAVTDAVGTVIESYGRGAFGNALSAKTGAAAARLLMADRHGDIIASFSTSGLIGSSAFDPFGTVLTTSGSQPQLGYQGEWTDADTGATNMHARWYQPGLGGFLSRDTWNLPPIPSGTANRYAYANGDPLNQIDPSGHRPEPPGPRAEPQSPSDRCLVSPKVPLTLSEAKAAASKKTASKKIPSPSDPCEIKDPSTIGGGGNGNTGNNSAEPTQRSAPAGGGKGGGNGGGNGNKGGGKGGGNGGNSGKPPAIRESDKQTHIPPPDPYQHGVCTIMPQDQCGAAVNVDIDKGGNDRAPVIDVPDDIRPECVWSTDPGTFACTTNPEPLGPIEEILPPAPRDQGEWCLGCPGTLPEIPEDLPPYVIGGGEFGGFGPGILFPPGIGGPGGFSNGDCPLVLLYGCDGTRTHYDTDNDGVPDSADADDDGDGVLDAADDDVANYTEEDVDNVEEHLNRPELHHSDANDSMIDRIRDAIREGRPLTEGEKNFMKHELTERELMDGGMSYDDAHEEAMKAHPLFKNYDPEVIDQHHELFNNRWRGAWDLPPR
ncbi:hypothetical protein Aple_059670 [Acrocarpospora pleiomorpha]|uniref:Intein C-terminal splicing domain-containing protein n=1 Tax=Acrocarpospora pleiomorpha TaxID=90975 RepID=A0A5M3XXN7_9ACTN|nr:RHS repeat-associated core domain-containing protein [Acrocarpospora pleiomorpha]GES23068.1 hypothetical protein Aple_059670 [Acrocarpospora pleiomorpha]